MRPPKNNAFLASIALSLSLIFCISFLTNSITPTDCKWDCIHYLGLAENGFSASPLVSPFAYRYVTPFLAGFLKSKLNISIFSAFRLIAWLGAFFQLIGVFLFIKTLTKSHKSAYIAMFITALSFFNVKFLLFDVSRPDHLAYPLILLAFFLAVRKRFSALVFVTVIGVQVREFVALPLIAYLITEIYHSGWKIFKPIDITFIGLFFASIIAPRMLIPVSENGQFIPLTFQDLPKFVGVPLNLNRDLNIFFSGLVYFLPTFLLITLDRIKQIHSKVSKRLRLLVGVYSFLVVLLTLYGGTDIPRFISYLFLLQIILVGLLVPYASKKEMAIMLTFVFIFNRMWMLIPIWDFTKYLNFYGGFSSVVNENSLLRFLEFLGFLILTQFFRRGYEKQSTFATS